MIKQNVAIQGIRGAFHEEAARGYYCNEEIMIIACETFRELVQRVVSGEADSGIMAIENSVAGSILPNYALLAESGLKVTGEICLPIVQNLLALHGQGIEDIKEVRSHPMALLQCSRFFVAHPDMRLVETRDTAISVKEIAQQRLSGVAGVGSVAAARIYDVAVLAPHIQDEKQCTTRFLEVRKSTDIEPQNSSKASVRFTAMHQSGSLAHILTVLADQGINLTKIQSLPIPERNWEYRFYIDMEYPDYQTFHETMQLIVPLTHELEVMGIYNKGKTL